MFNPRHFSFRVRALLLLGVCVLAFGVFPAHQLTAAVVPTPLDNTIAEYGRGSFQRTSLGPLTNTSLSPKVVDKPGAIQLGPIGLLNKWTDTLAVLKKSLIRMGATAIGNHVYVIGGQTPVNSATQSVADVWSAPVSQANGAVLEDWTAEPSLPKVKGSNKFPTTVAEINSPGVVSVESPSGGGFIYVIGGNTAPSTSSLFDYSSYAVRIAKVNPDGHIPLNGWSSGPDLPSPDGASDPQNFNKLGLQSSQVVKMVVNGKTYIYVIGGLRRYTSGPNRISEGSKDVFYAEVNPNGSLVKPGTNTAGWVKLASIPFIPASPAGIWDGVAFGDHFVASTGESSDVIYVAGGQLTPDDAAGGPTFNASVYRAFVASNGTLTWDFGWQGTLPQPRTGFSGVAFRGSLYAVGGTPNNGNQPDTGVLTSYVEDDVTLHQFNAGEIPPGVEGGGSNFLKSNALLFARAFHAVALVEADATSPNSAFIYVFGGRGKTVGTDDQGSNTVFYGKVGGDENVANTGYATSGWYYSQPYDINFTGAHLQKIYWSTQIDRSAAHPDIAVSYRISSGNSCANADWTDASWQSLDSVESGAAYTSAIGPNTSPAIDLTARCFQYRVKLSTDDYHVTPSLLNVSIDLNVPGNPDLNPKSVTARRGINNTFLGLDVVIQNVNTFEQTLAADIEQGGSFFVDLCIFKPNATVTKPTIPFNSDVTKCSFDAFANTKRSYLKANAAYIIPEWQDNNSGKVVNLTDYFKTPGKYTVYLVVDSLNNVNEGQTGAEGNNISQAYSFDVNKVGYQINIPLVRK